MDIILIWMDPQSMLVIQEDSKFVEAIQEEEDKFVWGTMAELKKEVKESTGSVTTRA